MKDITYDVIDGAYDLLLLKDEKGNWIFVKGAKNELP